MAQRRSGQEGFGFGCAGNKRSSLDELASLINWQPIAVTLSEVHAAAKGDPAWPPLTLLRAMLIAI